MPTSSAFAYKYPRPAVTVDVAVFSVLDGSTHVLLIRRAGRVFTGAWALPGGFVDPNESLATAARRELGEETGLSVSRLWPAAAYGDPGRDPRGWTISVVFYALLPPSKTTVRAGDDAAATAWKPVDRVRSLAFDHGKVLRATVAQLRRELYVLPVAKPLLPARFSVAELREAFLGIDGQAPKVSVFKRRLLDAGVIRPVSAAAGKFCFACAGPGQK